MNHPLVSISCITYNHTPYIRECLDGFLMQKCDFDFEVLIHDDASTDGTQEIIREYQEKYPEIIKPILQKENQWSQGVRGINLKFNFSRAKGKYIALCEGDDYWTDPLKLQKQVDFLEENEDYGACFTDSTLKNLITKEERSYNKFYKLKQGLVTKELIYLYGGGIYPTATFILRTKYCNLSQNIKENLYGDEKIIFSLAMKDISIYYLNEDTAVYNVWSGGIYSNSTKTIKGKIEVHRNEVKEYIKFSKKLSKLDKSLFLKRIKHHIFIIIDNSKFRIQNLKYIPYIGLRTFIKRTKWL